MKSQLDFSFTASLKGFKEIWGEELMAKDPLGTFARGLTKLLKVLNYLELI